ncbi:putative transcriptional regulator [Rhodoblastus acidophilus]|uniref:MucR family transcriptional regulator n=1 Tax=Rhodoblastus acidophilus TaxID=1074 RepID=UPI0022247892|nr:MucR family transcriptional regulator [Rhodoblastus acidophilus]MCW2317990.1 putative transcriptional regulator [Rhodoblastus acidophilus]
MSDFEDIEHTTHIVSAYVSNNPLPLAELPGLIASVHDTVLKIVSGKTLAVPEPELTPAVSIRKSLTNDALICLECGGRFKSLRRHLMTDYGLSPDQYRAKWKLPTDYPMVAPAYAAQRSELARSIGLGQQRRKKADAEAPAAIAEPAEAAPKPRAEKKIVSQRVV